MKGEIRITRSDSKTGTLGWKVQGLGLELTPNFAVTGQRFGILKGVAYVMPYIPTRLARQC